MIKALNFYILCRKEEKAERKVGSIIIAASAQSNQEEYTVVSAPEVINEGQGVERPCFVKVGDRVLMQGRELMSADVEISPGSGTENVKVFQEHQVVCILP